MMGTFCNVNARKQESRRSAVVCFCFSCLLGNSKRVVAACSALIANDVIQTTQRKQDPSSSIYKIVGYLDFEFIYDCVPFRHETPTNYDDENRYDEERTKSILLLP